MREQKYTNADLIYQVQKMAERLGRTPTQLEFSEDKRTASSSTTARRFGSWNKFLEEAGLEINKIENYFSDEELFSQVQELYWVLGRVPTQREFDKATGMGSGGTIARRFGSWNRFLKKAGLELNRHVLNSSKELLRQLRILSKELGRTPTYEEFVGNPRTASGTLVKKFFGSWPDFIDASGLKPYKQTDKESLIEQAKTLSKKLGRAPTQREFADDPTTAGVSTAVNRFGSWNGFLEEAGLKPNRVIRRRTLRK